MNSAQGTNDAAGITIDTSRFDVLFGGIHAGSSGPAGLGSTSGPIPELAALPRSWDSSGISVNHNFVASQAQKRTVCARGLIQDAAGRPALALTP